MSASDHNRTFDLVGIGECMVEFHAPVALGEARTLTKGFGGDVLNTLVHASRSGLVTAFLTQVGNDPFGDYLLRAWREEAVGTTGARLVEGINGVYFISVDDHGERQFTYRRTGSAAARMRPEALDRGVLGRSSALFASGISQAISESAEAVVDAALAEIDPHVEVCYDPNYRPALWAERGGLEPARAAFERAAARATWLLPSYPADLPLVSDRSLGALAALRAFATRCDCVAMKMGEEGVLISVYGAERDIGATAEPEVVDTTGAGDAWNGVFLAGVLRGRPAPPAAQAANVYAAATLAHRGAIPPRQSDWA